MANDLAMRCQSLEAWDAALARPGLQVFTTGSASGVNSVHPLLGGMGVVLGKLFRRSDLDATPVRHFHLGGAEATRIVDSGGRALVADFWGRYVAFIQTASGSTAVLRDRSGTLPCFRIVREGVSIVFSWLEDALRLLAPAALPAVNWDALLAQLAHGLLGGRETALEGVTEVLAGEWRDLHTDKSTLLWSAVDIALCGTGHAGEADLGADEATRQLGRAVRSCTRAWAACYDTVLLRLSGGVDSSIVLSCLAPGAVAADVMALNYYSPGSDSDERHYARLSAARVGRDLLEREREGGFKVDRVLSIARMPAPVPYVGWMNASTDASVAAAYGAPALFTGAGGDPLFYEFPRWWPAADYLARNGMNTGFAAAAMDAARLGRLSVWRTALLAFKETLRPDLSARSQGGFEGLLAPEVRQGKTSAQRFAHPGLASATDLPIGKYMQTVSLMHPLGYYDPFEQAAAPELVNPLLSQPLVELCLRLPTYLLTQGGRGRALARRAFAADLPSQVINRRSKGGMEEHIKAVLAANIETIKGMLLEGQLSARGLLDRGKVEELLSGRPTKLIGAVSEIHGLVAVEAWLARWPR
ncbi:asparagine synthase-related protein [Roseateles sp.]|uniref:asparagine synthase-related protein n=1 Tax=Roseateles sp. TaxID=1971397 RepID=UPI0032653B92